MLGRIAAAAALIALAGCAGMESAGRTSSRSPEPARVVSAPPPAAATAPAPTMGMSPPPQAAPTTPAPSSASTPPPASSQSAAPQADRPVTTASRSNDDDVVVPGQRERQVQPPDGDPRSNAERMQDIRSWDQCVMRVQSAAEANPMRPQLETPEDYCRQSLGMASRTALPDSRLERR